jgi:hypothetical protein
MHKMHGGISVNLVSNGKIRTNFAGRAIVLHVVSVRVGDLRSFNCH